jgi:hypothetical protein
MRRAALDAFIEYGLDRRSLAPFAGKDCIEPLAHQLLTQRATIVWCRKRGRFSSSGQPSPASPDPLSAKRYFSPCRRAASNFFGSAGDAPKGPDASCSLVFPWRHVGAMHPVLLLAPVPLFGPGGARLCPGPK